VAPRAVALVSLAAIVLVAGAGASTQTTTTVFRDASGEEPAGPDLTAITVSSDGRELAFAFAVPTSPAVTGDMRIRIWLDADDDRATGLTVEGLEGFDHFLIVDPTRFRLDEAVLYTCSESVCGVSGTGPPRAPGFTYANGAARFTVDAELLGVARVDRVRFSVAVYAGIRFGPDGYDLTDARIDTAPNEGWWVFHARPLTVAGFRPVPAKPRAGRPFVLTMRVLRTGTGAPLGRGQVTCALVVAGERVPARAKRLVAGRAECAFRVPTGTTGRRFRASIGVAGLGTVVSRSLSGRVG
jgi:hypothetical protein